MSIMTTDRIPHDDFPTFHSILKETGGRYLENPFFLFDHDVSVKYEFDSIEGFNDFNERWNRTKLIIKETRSDTKFNIILRRIKLLFKWK